MKSAKRLTESIFKSRAPRFGPEQCTLTLRRGLLRTMCGYSDGQKLTLHSCESVSSYQEDIGNNWCNSSGMNVGASAIKTKEGLANGS